MFFLLSKTLSYLMMPFTVICLCLLASVLIRNAKWKKRLFWIAFSLLFFLSNDFIANEMMAAWEPDAVAYRDIKKKYAWGIVLTGVANKDREPKDRVYFAHGADRVTHAVQLYKLGLVKKLLVSGGSGRLINNEEREALVMKEAMILMGVPEEHIMVEPDSRNTHESAVEVKKILDVSHIEADSCLLITSAFHMRRSRACFRNEGLDLDIFSTDFYSHPRLFTPDVFIIPKLEAIGLWQRLMKEWVGMTAYKFAGYI